MNDCSNCNFLMEEYKFGHPQTYLTILSELEELVKNGSFELIKQTCDFAEVKGAKGWYSDAICHTIRCKECGDCYKCSCDTYHGNGIFVRLSKDNRCV